MSETLIVIPGWGTFDHSYKKLRSSDLSETKIHIFDYHRKSPKISEIAESLKIYLEDLGLEKVALLGHSYGGAIALDFTAKYPDLIKHLYLVNSEGIYGQESMTQLLKSLLLSKIDYWKTDPLATLHSFIGIISRPHFAYQTSMNAYNANLINEAKSIQVPTTILWGNQDIVTPIEQGRILHGLIPNSKLIEIEGQGHDWISINPKLFWENV